MDSLLPSNGHATVDTFYSALNDVLLKIGFDNFRDYFMGYLKHKHSDACPQVKILCDHGIVIKIIHDDMFQFYYQEKPGAGIGFMDWSTIINPGWHALFRQGGVFRASDGSPKLFYGLEKAILKSQFRNRKIPESIKEMTIQTKTDGSAMSCISWYDHGKKTRISCWSTNKNSGVDPRMENEFINAISNSGNASNGNDTHTIDGVTANLINDIIEFFKLPEDAFISMHIEFVGNNLLASYHPINCIWFNQIDTSTDTCHTFITETYESIQNLTEYLEKKGYRCPNRFVTVQPFESLDSTDSVCDKFVEDSVNMEFDQIRKYGTVAELSDHELKARILSTFEGFVVDFGDQNVPNFKVKYPMFKLVNKLSFGRTPEFREKLLVALFEINFSMGHTDDAELLTICSKYDPILGKILKECEINRLSDEYLDNGKKFLKELYNNICKDFDTYDIGRLTKDIDLKCLIDSDTNMLVSGRTLHTVEGLKELYDDTITAVRFRAFWQKYVSGGSHKTAKNLKLFRGAFRSNSPLKFILSLPPNLSSGQIFKDSTIQTYRKTKDRDEDVTDDCLEQYLHTIKTMQEFGPNEKWLICDMDGTLLYLPEDHSLIGQWNNVPSRMCTHLNTNFCKYVGEYIAKNDLKICILTGAKVEKEDIHQILRNVPFKIDVIQPGYFGSFTTVCKRRFFVECKKAAVNIVAFIDDDDKIFQHAKDLVPIFKVYNGVFGKATGNLPTMIGFLGCPGMGKSTLCTSILNHLPNSRHFNLDMARLAGKSEGTVDANASDVVSFAKKLLQTPSSTDFTILYDQMGLDVKSVQNMHAVSRSMCIILVPREFYDSLKNIMYDAKCAQPVITELANYFSRKQVRESTMEILKSRIISRSDGNGFESTFHAAQIEKGILTTKYNAMIKALQNKILVQTYAAFAFLPMDLDTAENEIKDIIPVIQERIQKIDTTMPFNQYSSIVLDEFDVSRVFDGAKIIKDLHVTLNYGFDNKYATELLDFLASNSHRVTVRVTGQVKSTTKKGQALVWLTCELPEHVQHLFRLENKVPHVTLIAPPRLASIAGYPEYAEDEYTVIDNFEIEGVIRIC